MPVVASFFCGCSLICHISPTGPLLLLKYAKATSAHLYPVYMLPIRPKSAPVPRDFIGREPIGTPLAIGPRGGPIGFGNIGIGSGKPCYFPHCDILPKYSCFNLLFQHRRQRLFGSYRLEAITRWRSSHAFAFITTIYLVNRAPNNDGYQ